MKTLTKREQENIMLMHKIENVRRINPDKNTFSDIIPFIHQMEKYERQLQKLAEHSCNGYPMQKVEYRDSKRYVFDIENVAWHQRCEKKETIIENRVRELAAVFNLAPDFQGDPRGLMFRLKDKEGREIL